MLYEHKIRAANDMKHNVFRYFFVVFRSFFAGVLCITGLISVLYLFVIDTSFLSDTFVFSNEIIHVLSCAFVTAEIIFLFFVYILCKLKKDVYLASGEKYYPTISVLIKGGLLYCILFLKKAAAFVLFLLPFSVVCFLTVYFCKTGLSIKIFTVFIVTAVVLFAVSLYYYRRYLISFLPAPYIFSLNPGYTIKDIFAFSDMIMKNKTVDIQYMRIYNLPKKLLCLLLFPAIYYLPYFRIMEYNYVFDNKNPYPSETDTEKPVVFYLDSIKEF